jgi:hypothetical protein
MTVARQTIKVTSLRVDGDLTMADLAAFVFEADAVSPDDMPVRHWTSTHKGVVTHYLRTVSSDGVDLAAPAPESFLPGRSQYEPDQPNDWDDDTIEALTDAVLATVQVPGEYEEHEHEWVSTGQDNYCVLCGEDKPEPATDTKEEA